MSEIPSVVLDTQVFLRSLINIKSASSSLVFNMDADYKLYTCEQIVKEVLAVLNRPKIRSRFLHITDVEVRLVSLLLDQAHRVEVKPEDIEPLCRDPKDDIFLACAKVANADYLVSEGNDLLVIGQHHATKIVNIIDFLSVLQQQQTPPPPES